MAEKELIQDMCDPMKDGMNVVKAFKKKHWTKPKLDEASAFTSYVIKTACLWVYELSPLTKNPLVYCREVLDWLVTNYDRNIVPHYFIPSQNLIGHLTPEQCSDVSD